MSNLKIQVILDLVEKVTAPLKTIQKAAGVSGQAIKEFKSKIRELEKQQSKINEFKQMHQAMLETANKATMAESKLNQLKEKISQTVTPTKQLSREFERAQEKVRLLDEQLKQDDERLHKLTGELRQAGISTQKLAHHEAELARGISQAHKGLVEQNKLLGPLKHKLEQAANAQNKLNQARSKSASMAASGMGMAVAGGVGMTALQAPVGAYATAEDASTQLAISLMDKSGKVSEEFAKINSLATQLGDKLPGTTADFTAMMTMLKRQGLSSQSIINGTGEATANLAVLLQKLPVEAAEFAAKMQDATRTTEKDMLDLMDVIQRTYYLGVDDNDMLQAFSKFSPALKTLRKEGLAAAKEIAPLFVLFNQVGMAGEASGNAMRKVLDLSMDKDKRDKVNKALKKTGIQLNLSDGKGEFAGIDHMFKEFAKLKHLNREKLIDVLKEQWGDDGETHQVLSVLIDKGKDGYGEVLKKMEQQANLKQRVDKQLGTLKSLWDATSGTFTNFLVAIGEAIAPELKQLTQWLGDAAASMRQFAAEHPTLTKWILKLVAFISATLLVFGLLAIGVSAVLGPFALLRFAFTAVGLNGGRLLKVFGFLGKCIVWVGKVFWVACRFLLMNPIGLAITAVLGLAYAANWLYKNWEPARKFFDGIWREIKSAFNGGLKGVIKLLINFSPVGALYSIIAKGLSHLGVKLPTRFTDFAKMLFKGFVDGIKSMGSPRQIFDRICQEIKSAFNGGLKGVIKLLINFSPFGVLYSIIAKGLSHLGIQLPTRFSDFGKMLFNGLINGIKSMGSAVKDAIFSMGEKVTSWFKEKLGINSPSRVFTGFGANISEGLSNGIQAAQNLPLNQVNHLSKRLTKAGAGLALTASLNPAFAGIPDAQFGSATNLARFDERPPLTQANKAAAPRQGDTIQITINAAPGTDAQAIAKAVAEELDKRERQKDRAKRSALHDYDAY